MSEHKTLTEALCAFQAEAPTLAKDTVNPHFKSKFTSLDTIVETIRPLLAKHGLTWSTFPCMGENGEPLLRYELAHVSGDMKSSVMPLMLAKADMQGFGSALTYARRYSITAVLNLVADEDDDGNGASNRNAPARNAQTGNGNGAPKLATPDDVREMVAAAKDLEPDQVKLALAACGISGVTTYGQVPAEKVAALTQALAGTQRS